MGCCVVPVCDAAGGVLRFLGEVQKTELFCASNFLPKVCPPSEQKEDETNTGTYSTGMDEI